MADSKTKAISFITEGSAIKKERFASYLLSKKYRETCRVSLKCDLDKLRIQLNSIKKYNGSCILLITESNCRNSHQEAVEFLKKELNCITIMIYNMGDKKARDPNDVLRNSSSVFLNFEGNMNKLAMNLFNIFENFKNDGKINKFVNRLPKGWRISLEDESLVAETHRYTEKCAVNYRSIENLRRSNLTDISTKKGKKLIDFVKKNKNKILKVDAVYLNCNLRANLLRNRGFTLSKGEKDDLLFYDRPLSSYFTAESCLGDSGEDVKSSQDISSSDNKYVKPDIDFKYFDFKIFASMKEHFSRVDKDDIWSGEFEKERIERKLMKYSDDVMLENEKIKFITGLINTFLNMEENKLLTGVDISSLL